MTSIERSLEALRRELHTVRRELSKQASTVQALERATERAVSLRVEERDVGARILDLERILDLDRVAVHVETAIATAQLVPAPCPHMLVSGLLPPDVYGAVTEAARCPVLFDDTAPEGGEIRMPPRFAPTHAIVTMGFLHEIVRRPLSARLLDRFAEPLTAFTRGRFPELPPFSAWDVEVTISQARIVRRAPGYVAAAAADRPWDFLNGILYLGRRGEDERFGSRLHTLAVPFCTNAMLAFFGSATAHEYESIPEAAAGTERYTYEFGIGPTRDGRRRLADMAGKEL